MSAVDATRFAHASEAEMARILDFYDVRWEYEPTTFPILWNLDGEVVESFAPDFYLPELDLFLEMTTLKQRLVRKKNRKLRRLRELYPDVRIKLFYARDFRAMMLKYGRLGLAESLSGTPGQVMPERPTADLLIAVDLAPGPAEAHAAAELLAAAEAIGAAQDRVAAEPAPAGPASIDRSAVPPMPRAKPRSRSGRRRRSAGVGRKAGAEREAGA
jgi:hypoxanthine phosphoribosyltransferase